jgi:hypothetical protein
MHSHIRNGAIVVALLASVGIASAQSPTAPAGSPPGGRAESPMNQGKLQLSAAQKTTIFQSVMKEKVKTPPPASLRLSVGSEVPGSTELYALPANVVTQVPAAKTYKYTVAQNQVVIVDPISMKIVEIIKQ